MAMCGAVFRHGWHFVRIHIFERNHVDAHFQPCAARICDSLQNLLKIAAACNFRKGGRIQAVEADIDAFHAIIGQDRRILRQTGAVGRQRQFVERPGLHMPAKFPHQNVDIAPDQRLAARQPYFANAMFDETRCDKRDFGVIEYVCTGQECLMLRHAIGAAKIAPVGDRYSQIIDCASEIVLHRLMDLSVLSGAGNG